MSNVIDFPKPLRRRPAARRGCTFFVHLKGTVLIAHQNAATAPMPVPPPARDAGRR